MEEHGDVDSAIDDIVNEAIATDEEDVVKLNMEGFEKESEFSKRDLQKKIDAEFNKVVELLDFNNKAYDIFRRWYVDGRIYYNVIVDEAHPEEGIKELRNVDPRKIRKVREIKRVTDPSGVVLHQVKGEYYVFAELGFSLDSYGTPQVAGTQTQVDTTVPGLRIAKDSVIHVTSGIMDPTGNLILSHLHPAMAPLNKLKLAEDSMVVYRFTRASEKRVFYVDTGSMNHIKSEQHVSAMATKHKNTLNFDPTTGEVRDDRRFMTMFQDYWFARREGSKTTEVVTLPGGQMQGQIDDVEYLQQQLYRALKVPISRLMPDQSGFNFGKGAEISRDELKFSKFVDRLRRRFSILFFEALIKQLKLKNIIGPDDEAEFYKGAWFEFQEDSHWTEQKDQAVLSARIEVAKDIQNFVGKYFSHEYVRKRIFRQTEDEIEHEDEMIEEEKSDPRFAEPINVGDPTFGGDATNGDPFDGMGDPNPMPGGPGAAPPQDDPTQQPQKQQLQEGRTINRWNRVSQKRRRRPEGKEE